MFVRCCHCKDCQRQTGSAFAVNALVEADRIERLRGTPQRRALPTSSGRPHSPGSAPNAAPRCGAITVPAR